jgi:RND family efflux transporter MFP subunit
MEIIVTIAYFFLVRLIFFDYKLLKFNLFWKFVVFGIYAGAALTEIIALGQFTPYSKELVVESRVLQIAPEYGGIVKKVYVKPNVPIKKGDPLFEMDPAPRQAKVDEIKAQLAEAREKYNVERRLVRQGAGVREKMINLGDEVDAQKARLDNAQFHLEQTVIVAPADGYVVNLQLREGVFIRLKAPAMSFVDTEEYYLIALLRQRAVQWIDPGDAVEVALEMYPGEVFSAEVTDVIWASGKAQLSATGQLPTIHGQIVPPEYFVVKIRLKEEDPERPLRFGASGLAAIYSGKCDACKFLRQLEIRSESWLNYVYNPF